MLPGLNAVDGLKRFFLRRARFFHARAALYYPLIEIVNTLRLDLRHASLLPLSIYLHYALREAPRLTQIHLANLIQPFYQRIVL